MQECCGVHLDSGDVRSRTKVRLLVMVVEEVGVGVGVGVGAVTGVDQLQ